MSTTVTVRDPEQFKASLTSANFSVLPKEIQENGALLVQVLQHAPKVLPTFSRLNEREIGIIAHSTAVFLRPDLILSPTYGLCFPVTESFVPRIYGEDGIIFHPLNNPKSLSPEFKLSEDLWPRGGEFCRSYGGAFSLHPDLAQRVTPKNSGIFGVTVPLADLTAYLLDPRDLTDYRYTEDEVHKFHRLLQHQLSEL